MAQQATIYRILIASPSDVQDERDIAKNVIYQWNADNSVSTGVVLIPVMWETDVLPGMGNEPQQIINEQIVDECDLAIALFWTRIGSKTKTERSGTIEEIKRVISKKKHVLIGFSQTPCPPSFLDIEQVQALREYQSECAKKGVYFTFSSHDDFKYIFASHLSKITSRITSVPLKQTISMKKGQEASSYNVQNDIERLSLQAKVNHNVDMKAINYALNNIQSKSIKVLDVGCGYGHVTYQRFNNIDNVTVTAIDKSKKAIESAKYMNKSLNIEYKNLNYTELVDKNETFDIVFCSQFLQHIENPEAVLSQLWKIINPGGFIIARNSDDGADIVFPFNNDLEEFILTTDKLVGSSDRLYGRKMYTHFKRLYPKPIYTNMFFNALSTTGLTPKERGEYFIENHSFRLNYLRDLASKPEATVSDIQLLNKYEKTYLLHKERYINEDDIFEVALQFVGIAQKG